MGEQSPDHGTSENGELSPREKVQQSLDVFKDEDYTGHDAIIPKILKMESVTFEPTEKDPHNARSVFSFVVPSELCNMRGDLHGGAVALIFDITTSITINAVNRDGFWDTVSNYLLCILRRYLGHVSRTLNCTYLRPASQGMTVFVESQVVHLGKRLGQTTGVMRLGSKDGKICYTCEHGKASVGSPSL